MAGDREVAQGEAKAPARVTPVDSMRQRAEADGRAHLASRMPLLIERISRQIALESGGTAVGATGPLQSRSIEEERDVLALAGRHRVIPLLVAASAEQGASDEAQAAARALRDQFVMAAMLAARDLHVVLDVLAAGGVRVLALKGVSLAAQTTGNFTSRGSGDIDLLVSPRDVVRVSALLLDAGMTRWTDFCPSPESALFPVASKLLQESVFYIGDREIDVHWRLDMSRTCLNWDFDDLWARRAYVDVAGLSTPTLGLLDAATFNASHGAKDAWSKLGQVVDHIRLSGLVEPSAIRQHAAEAGALRRWEVGEVVAEMLTGGLAQADARARILGRRAGIWLRAGLSTRDDKGVRATTRLFAFNIASYDRASSALQRAGVLVWPLRAMAAGRLGAFGERHPWSYAVLGPAFLPGRLLAKLRSPRA